MKASPDEIGLRVDEIATSGVFFQWNRRCHQTFPEDEIRRNDIIVSVNGISLDTTAIDINRTIKAMGEELYRAQHFFLMMCRVVSPAVTTVETNNDSVRIFQ